MKLRHHALVAAGLAVPAACSPAPTAVRGRALNHSASPPAEPSTTSGTGPTSVPDASTTTSAAGGVLETPPAAGPTTTVTVTLPHATTTTTLVLPERHGADIGDVEWLVRNTFPEDPDRGARIAWAESKFDPSAVNGQYRGVMQIGSVTHAALIASMGYTTADLLNAVVNLHVARRLFELAGWSPWA